MKLKTTGRHLDEALARGHDHESKRAVPMTFNDRASKRCGTLHKLWYPTPQERGIYIAHWLTNAGLPYNIVASEDFKLLV